MPAVHGDIQASDKEEKNPHFPVWKTWILISLIVSQILTAVQIRQANEEAVESCDSVGRSSE